MPDPRPVVIDDGTTRIAGFACTECGHPLPVAGPWCPRCQSDLEPREFGPGGRVWSSTVFRVPLQDRRPPWVLVWVDLDDGPRVLAHVDGPAERLPIGTRTELIGVSATGDLLVRGVEDEGAQR